MPTILGLQPPRSVGGLPSSDERASEPPVASPAVDPLRSLYALAVVMVASLLALAVALVVGVGFGGVDSGAATPVELEGSEVTYGSAIKLMHEKAKHRLHSHDVPYGSGSGQQSVIGFPEGDDSNSYWRLETKYASDPTKYEHLHNMVKVEVSAMTAKSSSSCTNGLI